MIGCQFTHYNVLKLELTRQKCVDRSALRYSSSATHSLTQHEFGQVYSWPTVSHSMAYSISFSVIE